MATRRAVDMDEIGADLSRAVIDAVCTRIVKPDFDIGALPYRPSAADLIEFYVPPGSASASDGTNFAAEFANKLVLPREWEDVSQRVMAWQDATDAKADGCNTRAVLRKVLGKTRRFPTIAKVAELLGEAVAERYKSALEEIECNPGAFAEFPSEQTCKGWNQQSAEKAVSLVVDVIAPHGNDPISMADAFARHSAERRARNQEKDSVGKASIDEKKRFARSLGIWLPKSLDHRTWRSDPRTRTIAPEFLALAGQVFERMKATRSILQYVRKRKFSERSVLDMEANMIRMRAYLRDYDQPLAPAPVFATTSNTSTDSDKMLFCFSSEDDDDDDHPVEKEKKRKRTAQKL